MAGSGGRSPPMAQTAPIVTADTNGYEKDREQSIWPYRDWVIQALNDDMPFDLLHDRAGCAGDLTCPVRLPHAKVATGLHRSTMINEEGGDRRRGIPLRLARRSRGHHGSRLARPHHPVRPVPYLSSTRSPSASIIGSSPSSTMSTSPRSTCPTPLSPLVELGIELEGRGLPQSKPGRPLPGPATRIEPGEAARPRPERPPNPTPTYPINPDGSILASSSNSITRPLRGRDRRRAIRRSPRSDSEALADPVVAPPGAGSKRRTADFVLGRIGRER